MKKKILRVGFDLDGVILYNPVRVGRPFAKWLKMKFRPERKKNFYIPHSKHEQLLWRILHASSLFVAPGYEEIKQLSSNHTIEVYLITARFSFMKRDFEYWKRKMRAEECFKECFYNAQNLQPHRHKEQLIKSLKLDVFVDDNYDIVEQLTENTNAKILWITNVLDRKIPYPYKFANLKEAVHFISQMNV